METYYQGFNRIYIDSNNEQGSRFQLFLKICLAGAVVQVLLAFWLYMSARNSDVFNPHRNVLQAGFNMIFGLLEMTASIFFFIWIYRAYSNLHTAGIRNLNYDRVWSIAAWFVPLLNFYRPYIILKELWYWNQTAFREQAIIPKEHSFLRYWWLSLFIPIPLAVVFSLMMGPGLNSPIVFYAMGIFSAIFHTLSVYLLFRFMSDLRVFEEEFHRRFAIHQKNNLTALAEKFKNTQAESVPEVYADAAITLSEKDEILDGEVIETSTTNRALVVCLIILLCSIAVLTASNAIHSAIAMTAFWISICTGVFASMLFIYWLNVSYRNLKNLRVTTLAIHENLRTFWWIIPIVNMIVPYLMLRDLRQHIQEWPDRDPEKTDRLPVLDWTWLTLIIGLLFLWVSLALAGNSLSQSDESLFSLLWNGGWICLILSFAGAIHCLLKFRKWESDLFERVMKITHDRNPGDYDIEET